METWQYKGESVSGPRCISVNWKVGRLNEETARRIIEEAEQNRDRCVPLYKALDPVYLSLDWNSVPENEVQGILDALQSNNDRLILKYRRYFKQTAIHNAALVEGSRFSKNFMVSDYWEDKSGNPLTNYQMHKRATGGPGLIMSDTESVLDVGPAPMKEKHKWQRKDSDRLGHFTQVVGQIQRSRWCKGELTIGRYGAEQSYGRFPSLEDFVFAAIYYSEHNILDISA